MSEKVKILKKEIPSLRKDIEIEPEVFERLVKIQESQQKKYQEKIKNIRKDTLEKYKIHIQTLKKAKTEAMKQYNEEIKKYENLVKNFKDPDKTEVHKKSKSESRKEK